MNRNRWLMVGGVVLAVGVLACAGLCGAVYTSGLEVAMSARRAGLEQALGETRLVQGSAGKILVYEGGEGPGVVLVHGFGDQAITWADVAPGLVEAGYRVVVLDLPGHGLSAPEDPAADLTFDMVYGGLVEVMETVDGEPTTIVGNSMGGWMAMRYALDHPDRVDRIVLVNAAGLTQDIDDTVLIPKDRDAFERKMVALFDERVPPVPGFVKDQIIAMGDQPRYHALYADLRGHHLDDELAELTVPADLVWGEGDGFFPMDYAERLDAAIPASRLQTMPGCAHAPQVICAPELTEVLVDLLEGAPPPMPVVEEPDTDTDTGAQ